MPWIIQAFCWAHLRRRFRDLGKVRPEFRPWVEAWRLRIVLLNQFHRERRRAEPGTPRGRQADATLHAHVAHLGEVVQQELALASLPPEQRSILVHLQRRWAGYTRFLEDPAAQGPHQSFGVGAASGAGFEHGRHRRAQRSASGRLSGASAA